MKNLLFIIGILLIPCSTEAVSNAPIVGGFGYKLGEVLNTSGLTQRDTSGNSGEMYATRSAPRPVDGFSWYIVVVTPKEKKIASVSAMQMFEDRSECTNRLEVLLTALEKKYGKSKEPGFSMDKNRVIQQGNRALQIACSGFMTDVKLILSYVDTDLSEQATREVLERKSKDIDGL